MSWYDVDSAFAEMQALSRQVDALIGQGGRFSGSDAFTEEGEELVWRADLPGTKREEVDVKLENGVLSVAARRRRDSFEGMTARHRERRAYEVHRSWTLPDTVDPESVSATMQDGVLSVRVRRQPAPQPRRVTVT